LALVVGLLAFALTERIQAATYTVTSTGTSSATVGTLAWAIAQSNASVGTADTVNFAITGTAPFVIDMGATTLSITDGVTIDGFTQTGASMGNLMAGIPHSIMVQVKSTATVLKATASNVTIRGLAIGGVTGSGHGIQVQTAGDNDLFEGCYVGFAADGVTASAVNQNGIRVEVGANVVIRNCVVGNSAVQASNSYSAISLTAAAVTGGIIENCFVGTNATGMASAPNGTGTANSTVDLGGIEINGPNAVVRNNLCSGNSGVGIVNVGAANTRIQNNIVGLNRLKTAVIANTAQGIFVSGGSNLTLQGNVVAGNTSTGIYLIESTALDAVFVDNNIVGTDAAGSTKNFGNHKGGI
jgi:parallel beta-helix repeat protein